MSLASDPLDAETLATATEIAILVQALKLLWDGHKESSLIIQNALDAVGRNDDTWDERATKFLTTRHDTAESP